MDTKLKNNRKWLGNLICILIILCTAVATVVSYQPLKNRALSLQQMQEDWSNQEEYEQSMLSDYVNKAYAGGYGFYWDIQQKVQDQALDPYELYYPSYYMEAEEEDDESYGRERFNENFRSWNNMYQNAMLAAYGVKYQVVDNQSGEFLTNASEDLSGEMPENYAFFMKYSFDEQGNFSIQTLKSKAGIEKEELDNLVLDKSYVLGLLNVSLVSPLSMRMPKDITVYLMSDNEDCYYMGKSSSFTEYSYSSSVIWLVEEAGFNELLFMTFLLLAALALLLPLVKNLEVGKGIFGKMPLEIVAFLCLAPVYAQAIMSGAIAELFFYPGGNLYGNINPGIPYLIHAGVWVVFYAAWFVAMLSARALFTLGIKRYFLERIWTVCIVRWVWARCCGFARWLGRKIKGFFRMCVVTLDDINLADPSDRMLFKVLGLNFFIVFFCCVLWYFGVAALILYTVILFFILKRYMKKIKQTYGILLRSTRRMAEGDLQVEITEDVGIFEPLKVELNKVQVGFRKAVEEETKSQNMKTELITNVSHDLRTPLTAIITYVNLLKNENITEEERLDYINILDRKSLRLKQLIEDLFEISKAASGNIKVEKKLLNLTELVKQSAYELEDRLKEAEIECRINAPKDDIFLMLDGEKTYRCMENLLINVSKYAMPKTRAYLNLYDRGDTVELVLKNVSREELTMDVEELTERFIRGDKSRNKEGSGLGLAIVKSFVELQGGSFRVESDGDLFKARIQFAREAEETNRSAEIG